MKKAFPWIALLAVFVLLAGVIYYSRSNNSGSQENVVVAQFGDLLLYLPLYIAADTGDFEDEGLSVQIISTGGDNTTFAAVLSGDAQFGIADPTFAAIAEERGGEGSVVGLLINGMPNYGVSARANADPIQNLNELAGKRFASVPAPSTAYAALEQLYRRAGLAPDIVQTSPAGLIAAAGQSDVYGAVLIEPWVSQVESEGGTVVLSMPDFYDDFALTGITASSRVQTENPQLIERFRNAIRNGVQTFYEDPDTTLQVAIARFPQESEEALRRGIERMREDEIYPRDLRVTQEAWEAAINLRIGSGDYGGSVEESWSVVSEMTR